MNKNIAKLMSELNKFAKNCSVQGKDKKKFYVINKEEEKALKVVIKLLKDCI